MTRSAIKVTPEATDTEAPSKREEIIAAAQALFLQNGFEGTPVSHIAKAAGVSTPALYWHFESKEALYSLVIKLGYTEFFQELHGRTCAGRAAVQLREYVNAFVDLQLRDRDVATQYGFHQLRAHLSAEAQEEIDESLRVNLHFLREILEKGSRDGVFNIDDFAVTALAISTMCEYVFTWFRPDGRQSETDVAAAYGDLALRMAGFDPSVRTTSRRAVRKRAQTSTS
jgi:AcrR family transcriptional regulator